LFQKFSRRTENSGSFVFHKTTDSSIVDDENKDMDVNYDSLDLSKTTVIYLHTMETVIRLLADGGLYEDSSTTPSEAALMRFVSSGNDSMREAKGSAQLDVDPLLVGLLANRLQKKAFLTPEASVYFAGFLDYIIEAIIEVARVGGRKENPRAILPRDVFQGLVNDEELKALFLSGSKVHGYVKQGGTKATRVIRTPKPPAHVPLLPFKSVFQDRLRTHGILIDPRDGKHKRLFENQDLSLIAIEVPELDAACLQSQKERMALAREALCPGLLQILKREEENCRDTHEYDICLGERDRTDYIFEPLAFKFLIMELLRDSQSDQKVTAEAVDILQVATEGILCDLLSYSGKLARGEILRCEDIKLAWPAFLGI
jgi:hypothetical protein